MLFWQEVIMTDYKKIPVQDLMPHSPPMVLIDKVIDYSDNSLVAELIIVPGCQFYDDSLDGVPSWVGIEYMAQAISVLGGIRALENNKKISIGFLLGTHKYSMPNKVFYKNQAYQVSVKELHRAEAGLAIFDCQILQGQEVWAESKINVFIVGNAPIGNEENHE